MKKIAVVSDSFKGSLTSREICEIVRACASRVFPGCQVVSVPVADGGEGTVACFHEACGGTLMKKTVRGPLGEDVEAEWLRLPGDRAVVEMASAAGLPLTEGRADPSAATTYGVGQLISAAVESGCRSVILGLGGSATNDGGCGCAAALGVRFFDRSGRVFVPVGGTLSEIDTIDVSRAERLLAGVRLRAMCDVENPLYGPNGAAAVYGPQKGADPAMVTFLDGQLQSLDRAVEKNLGLHVAQIPGAGAAGGFGAGMLAFFRAELCSGIETVLDTVDFASVLEGCELVFTGEGRLDEQSFYGKAVSGVARRAHARGVPTVVIAGSVAPGVEQSPMLEELGIAAIFSINRQAMDFSKSKALSRENYAYTFENVLRLLRTAQGLD